MAIGVNVREVDNSLYTNVSSTSPVLAVVGAATMGEVGVPTLCTSLKDFRSKFGSLNPECMAPYAAEWYLKKVARAYFVRAAGAKASTAKATFTGVKKVTVQPDPTKVVRTFNEEVYSSSESGLSKVTTTLRNHEIDSIDSLMYRARDTESSTAFTQQSLEGTIYTFVDSVHNTTVTIDAATGGVSIVFTEGTPSGGCEISIIYNVSRVKGFEATETVCTLDNETEKAATLQNSDIKYVKSVTVNGDAATRMLLTESIEYALFGENFTVRINDDGNISVNCTTETSGDVVVSYEYGEDIPEPVEEIVDVDSAFTIETKDVGTLYNGYTAIIANSSEDDKTFDLTIRLNEDSTPIVKVIGATLDSTSDKYVGAKLTSTPFRLSTIDDSACVINNGEYILAHGDNGLEDIDASIITCLEALKSNNYSIDIMSIPDSQSPAVIQAGLSTCEYRGDTLYLVDTPAHIDYQEAVKWVNGAGDYDDHAAFNSSYGACYYAWQTIYDNVNAVDVLVPPSIPVAVAIANSELMTKAWFAPAGLSRGVLSDTISSEFKPTDVEVDVMYDASINSIITHETAGLVVWGQKTLLRKDTSLNRVNVRRLMTYIKRIVRRTCQFFTFEPNDATTWAQFEDLLSPVFRSLVENRGIYDFKIVPMEDTVTDEDIDNSRMPAQILIKPTKAAEYIPVDIVLTSTGVQFN